MSSDTVIDSETGQPVLSLQEDTFCLAVIEYAGNLGAAYRSAFGAESSNAAARARLLISRPEIAKRIQELVELTQEHALITLGSHLEELANIRDMAKVQGDLKAALMAEVKRGEVVNLYKREENNANKRPAVFIGIGVKSSSDINDWSMKQGVVPIVIENGA